MHLLLIRHGQSFVNLDDWTGGYIDVGLTPLGRQQAISLGEWLAQNVRIDALYTSTMARTLETAQAIVQATSVAAQTDDRLREFGNCYADGLAVPAECMPVVYADFWGSERPYAQISDQGESWMLFRVRVGAFIEDVLERHGQGPQETTVVVVCHGGVIDAFFDYAFNVGPHRRVEIWTHNTGIVHWEYIPDSTREPWRLHAHGLAQHLINCESEWLGSSPMLHGAAKILPPAPPETGPGPDGAKDSSA
ncbi:MAG: histidine phosphatase family protein [Chloroflexi bacterium]|nr:histidine phosphatase family protein [Chloroflexota bacterium]